MVVTISMVLAVPVMTLHERFLALLDARKVAARIRPHRRAARAGHHRGLRALRADRLARAADVRDPVHRARSELRAGRFRAPLRQPHLLRRRVAPRAAAGGQGGRSEALRARDRRRRSVGQDARAVVRKHFPEPRDPRARAQPRALLPPARSRRARRSTATRSRRASTSRTRRCSSSVSASRPRSARSRSSGSTTRRCSQTQYAVHHDEAQLMQTAQQAAAQLQELFEADVAQRARREFPA